MATRRAAVPAGAEDEPRETAAQTVSPFPANTDEASVPEVAERQGDAAPESKTATFVRFANAMHFEERIISKRDFERAGITEGAEEIVWNRSNGFMVRKDRLTAFMDDEQYRRVILEDPRLEEVEA